VNVWCEFLCDKVPGPFFLTQNTVKSGIYLDMLENFVFPQIQDISSLLLSMMVHHILATFPGQWTGRGGPIPCPRSQLNTTKPFLWGYVHDTVHAERGENLLHLWHRITKVTPALLARV